MSEENTVLSCPFQNLVPLWSSRTERPNNPTSGVSDILRQYNTGHADTSSSLHLQPRVRILIRYLKNIAIRILISGSTHN